jgi:hypothetical protein
MKIRMRLQRVMQDIGRERPLVAGEVYDLTDRVARALIATGAAELADKADASSTDDKPARPAMVKRTA